jgi:hypothetical protein
VATWLRRSAIACVDIIDEFALFSVKEVMAASIVLNPVFSGSKFADVFTFRLLRLQYF